MANPYPPHMQPQMQQPHGQQGHPGHPGHPGQPGPMPMGPMPTPTPMPGAPPRAAVVRRGTSRAVPVVVSAGLAIGVFCGLLFGLGTGEEVIASPSTGNNVKTEETGEKLPIPPTVGTTAAKTADPAPATTTTPAAGSGTQVAAAGSASGSAAPAAGSAAGSAAPAAGSAAGSGAGSATTTAAAGSAATPPAAGSAASTPPAAGSAATPPPAAVAKVYKVKFKLMPDSLAATAKVTIDGKPIEGTEAEIDVGTAEKKTVKVVVKASGFKSYEKTLTVEGDTEMQVEMTKRPAGTPSGPRPGGGSKKPPGGGGGGLIDI